MKIQRATHYGMCFGVRDALKAATTASQKRPVTILGQLVHNPVVRKRLQDAGAKEGHLRDLNSASTEEVVITAHGAADKDRESWKSAGYTVTDTTCPLVHKAHRALRKLVEAGYYPVVIGKAQHTEVLGLTGDFPKSTVVEVLEEIPNIPPVAKIGIVSQTTQPITRVRRLVSLIQQARPEAEVRFIDTVCQPTKDRQQAIEELARANEVVIAVGGKNSNNTRQLKLTSEKLGARAYHVESPEEIDEQWFVGINRVGLTAGTSTPDDLIEAVHERLKKIATQPSSRQSYSAPETAASFY